MATRCPAYCRVLRSMKLTLLDMRRKPQVALSKYVAFANKCWPAFQTEFELRALLRQQPAWLHRLMPVSCEVDIYGALSEYICALRHRHRAHAAGHQQLRTARTCYDEGIRGTFEYRQSETFMGFHCGNTPACASDQRPR